MHRKGFTLIELLVSIAIIALLAGLILAGLGIARKRAREIEARRDIDQIKTALSAYMGDYGTIPDAPAVGTTGTNFVYVMRGGNRRGYTYMDFHAKSRGMRDPWEEYYQYELTDDEIVHVWSKGPNPLDTSDDIQSWRE